eukprot:14177919-Ditylum_brightwellii.AAC.1
MKYGGFQFAHLYLEQGYLEIKHLLGHLREETITGSGAPFLSEVKENSSYVADSWLGHLRTFLCQCKGKITIPHAWLPAPQQEHDHILMD